MYRMYRVIVETPHTRACARAHTAVLPSSRYIRYFSAFPLVRGAF